VLTSEPASAQQTLAPSIGRHGFGWARSTLHRLGLFAALAIVEIVLVTFLFDFDHPKQAFGYWQNPVLYANAAAKAVVVAFLLYLLVVWPRRREIAAAHSDALARQGSWYYLAANLLIVATLLLTKLALSRAAELSLVHMWLYTPLLVAAGASMALVAAPLRFWRALLRRTPTELALALGGASVAVAAGYLAQGEWDQLSRGTLWLSYWYLSAYEPNAFVDYDLQLLGVGDFFVQVFGACSGYEGIALVIATVSIYLWAFRRDLRFPNALLLFPVGIAAIWALNGLRIAVLVSIGAHVSPAVAVQGFHSAAGWICFLLVTFALIAASRRVPYFAARSSGLAQVAGPSAAPSAPNPALPFLAPFIALVGTSILASAFTPHDQWLYVVKVIAIAAVLWWYRDAYLPLLTGASWTSVWVGLAVGVAWIATDPDKAAGAPLAAWLATLPLWLAALWLAFRVFGTTVLVPIAEELAFRGYLARLLVSTRFESVPIGEYRALAFIGSTIAFGLVHQRWLAACLSGAIYALLMYRTKRLSDPIAAHAASNAAIAAWAVAMQQWSLL
jgi:exosortase E/protease (VPEID-CTERM system)